MLLRRSMILAAIIVVGLACAFAADITGKWTAQFDSQVGPQKYTFEFKADGANLTGMAISNIGGTEAKTPITEGKINGDAVTFVENLSYTGMDLKIEYKGTISGDEIKLSRTVGGQEGETFVAKRAK
jgi:FlaG/FlaF family flagellin (archaellin)